MDQASSKKISGIYGECLGYSLTQDESIVLSCLNFLVRLLGSKPLLEKPVVSPSLFISYSSCKLKIMSSFAGDGFS